jgi:hypothetical protein
MEFLNKYVEEEIKECKKIFKEYSGKKTFTYKDCVAIGKKYYYVEFNMTKKKRSKYNHYLIAYQNDVTRNIYTRFIYWGGMRYVVDVNPGDDFNLQSENVQNTVYHNIINNTPLVYKNDFQNYKNNKENNQILRDDQRDFYYGIVKPLNIYISKKCSDKIFSFYRSYTHRIYEQLVNSCEKMYKLNIDDKYYERLLNDDWNIFDEPLNKQEFNYFFVENTVEKNIVDAYLEIKHDPNYKQKKLDINIIENYIDKGRLEKINNEYISLYKENNFEKYNKFLWGEYHFIVPKTVYEFISNAKELNICANESYCKKIIKAQGKEILLFIRKKPHEPLLTLHINLENNSVKEFKAKENNEPTKAQNTKVEEYLKIIKDNK